MHSFSGSDAVTLNTTTSAELQTGCTTAHNANEFSSYFNSTLHRLREKHSKNPLLTSFQGVPTLYYVDGTNYTEVPFSRFGAYYINNNNAEVAITQN
jgi:hypothetical protein